MTRSTTRNRRLIVALRIRRLPISAIVSFLQVSLTSLLTMRPLIGVNQFFSFAEPNSMSWQLFHFLHSQGISRDSRVVVSAVDVETTQANGHSERDAAEKMAARRLTPGATLESDQGYYASEHLKKLQALGITPHVAAKRKGSAVTEAITQLKAMPSVLENGNELNNVLAGPKRLASSARHDLLAPFRSRHRPAAVAA